MSLEKAMRCNRLFDVYSDLLTLRQIEVFKYYYHEDFTYQEIADLLGISKAAVYDNITKTVHILEEYEEKLHLLNLIEELKSCNDDAIKEILKKNIPGGNYE